MVGSYQSDAQMVRDPQRVARGSFQADNQLRAYVKQSSDSAEQISQAVVTKTGPQS